MGLILRTEALWSASFLTTFSGRLGHASSCATLEQISCGAAREMLPGPQETSGYIQMIQCTISPTRGVVQVTDCCLHAGQCVARSASHFFCWPDVRYAGPLQ